MPSSPPDLAALLRRAALPAGSAPGSVVVAIGGEQLPVRVEPWGDGCTLSASIATPVRSREAVASTLSMFELASPGDTRLELGDGELRALRHLARPRAGALRDALVALARTLVRARGAIRAVADAVAAEAALSEASPPTPAAQADLDRAAREFPHLTVTTPQPAWRAPDPSAESVTHLQPGHAYQLLRREGDWAYVLTPDGATVYTDGRTLAPLPPQAPPAHDER